MATTRPLGKNRLDHLPRQVFHCFHLPPSITTDGAGGSDSTPTLNPRFVEALMGFPTGWTAFEHSATQWSPFRQQLLSELSRLVPSEPPHA